MTNTKFTPGPWDVFPEENKYKVYCDDSVGSIVADCSAKYSLHTSKQKQANALLCAAAPDMYEALQPFAELAKYILDDFSENAGNDTWVNVTEYKGFTIGELRALLTALSKAEGTNKQP